MPSLREKLDKMLEGALDEEYQRGVKDGLAKEPRLDGLIPLVEELLEGVGCADKEAKWTMVSLESSWFFRLRYEITEAIRLAKEKNK